MHLFSVALYYGMCFVSESVNGYGYSRPEFLYYWVYFVGFNAPWVVVPVCKYNILFSFSYLSESDMLAIEALMTNS